MSGLLYNDADVAMERYGDIPISTEQCEDQPPSPMDIDHVADLSLDRVIDTRVISATQRTKKLRYIIVDGEIYLRSKNHTRSKPKHKRKPSQPSPLGADALADFKTVTDADPLPGAVRSESETDLQASSALEEAKRVVNNSVDDDSDSDLDQPESETDIPAPIKATTTTLTSTSATTNAADLLAKAREVVNDARRKNAKTLIVAPDLESLKKQVLLLQEEAGALERKLNQQKDVSDSVIIDQQRQIEELRKSLDTVKDWSQDGPALESMYNDLKARNAKLEDELDEAIADRQALCDERDELSKVLVSMRDLQIESNDVQTVESSEDEASTVARSLPDSNSGGSSPTRTSSISACSVIQAVAALKKPEIRHFVLPEQSSTESLVKERSATSKRSKRKHKKQTIAGSKCQRKTDVTSPSKDQVKASLANQKLADELVTARHQLSGCHKKTRTLKGLIWELQREVKLLTESHQKDLETIQSASQDQASLKRQLDENQNQGALKDENLQTLKESLNSLQDDLINLKQRESELRADNETLIKDNRFWQASRSEPSRHLLEITDLKQSLAEIENNKNELEQTLQDTLNESERIKTELEELHRSHDEEAVYRRRAAAAGDRLEQLSANAVSLEDYEIAESNNALLHKANEILAATKEDLEAQNEELISTVEYYQAKFEAISRASPPASTSQQLRLYAEALNRISIGTKSERKQTIQDVKKFVAEQRQESFKAMRLTIRNLEEQWKEEFGMQGAYCKDRSASQTLPLGNTSALHGAAIAV